jgi:tRNA(fMet)-specific endonuclease VapC
MRVLLDTNRYIDLVAHDLAVAERIQRADQVFLSLISVGELLAGFARGSKRARNEERLRQLFDSQQVTLLLPDIETARFYAEISSQLRRQGRPIPTNDMWIAAQALQHGLTLDTRDGHFQHVPGLTLV